MQCLKCGDCCHAKTIPLLTEDIERISKITDIKFYRTRNTGATVLNWKPHSDFYVCIFFNVQTKLCNIYQNRPFVCKEYYCGKVR